MFETPSQSFRSSCLESQIINMKLKKNQQKVPGPPPKLSASDQRTCENFQNCLQLLKTSKHRPTTYATTLEDYTLLSVIFLKNNSGHGSYCEVHFVINNSTNTAVRLVAYLNFLHSIMKIFNNVWFPERRPLFTKAPFPNTDWFWSLHR